MNMEPMTAMLEGEWSSLSGMYTTEEADFMAQLLHNCSVPNENEHHHHQLLGGVGPSLGLASTTSWNDGYDESTMDMASGFGEGCLLNNYSSETTAAANNSNLYSFSQGSTYSGGGSSSSSIFPTFRHESCYYQSDNSHQILEMNDDSMTMDFCLGNEKSTGVSVIHTSIKADDDNVDGMDDCLINNSQEMSDDGNVEESHENLPKLATPPPNENLQQLNKESEMPLPDEATDSVNTILSKNKKRSANPNVQKNKRNVKPRKSLKHVPAATDNNDEEENNGVLTRQSSSSCSSEDYSIASQDLIGGMTSSLDTKAPAALNSSGKTRASRGSATDPQSLYARKRRERINERLRILQNLVPNGTKVDISTMLEEAVLYVKFLQLQIKLLSSDDLWMYAPLAYNGMDIGLDLKINAINALGR